MSCSVNATLPLYHKFSIDHNLGLGGLSGNQETTKLHPCRGGFNTVYGRNYNIKHPNNTAETVEIISACNSDISVSDQLITATDPVYSVCTLYTGNINKKIDLKVTTTTTAEVLVDATTTNDIPTITSRPTPETTMVTIIIMRATNSQPSY